MDTKINWKNNEDFRKYLIKYHKQRTEGDLWNSYEWYLLPSGYIVQIIGYQDGVDDKDIPYDINIYRISWDMKRILHTYPAHGNIVQNFMQKTKDGKISEL